MIAQIRRFEGLRKGIDTVVEHTEKIRPSRMEGEAPLPLWIDSATQHTEIFRRDFRHNAAEERIPQWIGLPTAFELARAVLCRGCGWQQW